MVMMMIFNRFRCNSFIVTVHKQTKSKYKASGIGFSIFRFSLLENTVIPNTVINTIITYILHTDIKRTYVSSQVILGTWILDRSRIGLLIKLAGLFFNGPVWEIKHGR